MVQRSAQAPAIGSSQIGTLALLAAISPLATGMYLPALPQMAADLAVSPASLQLTVTGFLAGLAVGQLVIGAVSDRTGRRGPLLLAGIACVAASAACAVAPTVGVLVAARFVQGLAGAAGIVLGRAFVADRSAGSDSARVFSILMTIGAVAPTLAPLLGGALLLEVGWRGIFWALTVIALLMVLGSSLALPESLPPSRRSGSWRTWSRSAASIITQRRYVGYTLVLVFSYATLIAYVTASPFVLETGFGLTPGWYSVVFAANAVGLTLGSLINARLVGRLGPRRLLGLGLTSQLVLAIALVVQATFGHSSLLLVLVLLWGCVASLGFIVGNATALALDRMPSGVGAASAIMGALQFGVAAVVAPFVGGSDGTGVLSMGLVMSGTAGLAALAYVSLAGARSRRRRSEIS